MSLRHRVHQSQRLYQSPVRHTCVVVARAHAVLALLLLTSILATILASCSGEKQTSNTLTGALTLAGSTALQPLATQAAQLFMKQIPGIRVEVRGGGSLAGLDQVTAHKIDIGNSDVYADAAVYPDPNLTDHLVCVIPFVMIVNRDVPVTNLRKLDIIDIFSTGKITNWQQVGGPNLNIVPVVRPATSGTRATFRKYVLAGRDETGTLLTSDSSQTVLKTVSSTPGAIGYLAAPLVNDQVRVVAIDGQLPTRTSIEQGRYAFWGFEHMYTIADSPQITAFLSFMLEPAVQQLAENLGYLPISAMNLAHLDSSHVERGVTDNAERGDAT